MQFIIVKLADFVKILLVDRLYSNGFEIFVSETEVITDWYVIHGLVDTADLVT